jgi:hypothetical protein
MKRIVLMMLGFFLLAQLYSQEVKFKVEVSTDSILVGNYFEVRFTIENAAGDFQAPEFEGFEILSGPNTSSSFSMINGQVSQKASYSYMIRPVREGTLYIDPAAFTSGETILETEPILIQVYPNPGGVEENKPFMQQGYDLFFEPKPKKKKRSKFEHKKRKI